MEIPSINQNICGAWTEQERELYNSMPFYLMKGEADYRQQWQTYKPLLGTVSWKANSGPIMRRVMNEPTPVMRQETIPNLITSDPLTDIINYRERKIDTKLASHQFVSPHFPFYPEFNDFLRHIDTTIENINKQILMFEDSFYRTMMFHHAPYIYIAGHGVVAAPVGDPNLLGTAGKTTAWLQAQINTLMATQPGNLSFQNLWQAMNSFENQIGATPYKGNGKPAGDSNPLSGKFCLVCGSQEWNNFTNDPWLKENRPLNMNIVTDAFRGDFFGRITTKLERYPYYAAIDANNSPSLPAPELVELNPALENFGQTVPNPLYALPENAQIGCAFLLGNVPGDAVSVGPPPPEFTRDLDQGSVVKMNWNGKTYLSKDFLIPCMDADGNRTVRMNEFGKYIRAQGELALAISLINSRNVLPVLFRRQQGVTTVA